MGETKLRLKLLVDKKSHRVVFAEADKKFVDFLISIFTLPVGAVARLLKNQTITGSLRTLYESIENLSDVYIQPGQDKYLSLQPKVSVPGGQVPILFPISQQPHKSRKFYGCTAKADFYANYSFRHDCCKSVSDDQNAVCPSCHKPMTQELKYVPIATGPSSSSDEGYVKGLVTYMVMDNLEIKPMSTISAITLLGKLGIRDIGVVEEKVVDFRMDEAVKLLAASLQSKTVLTNVFLGDGVEKVIGKVSDDVGSV